MTKPLIAVRHFPTPLNERGVSRGWLDVGIDKKAAEPLADAAARILDAHGIKRLVSSDLPRASESMKLIASKMKNKPDTDTSAALRTWNTGDMAGKKESETIPKREKYIKYGDEKPPGGEPFDHFIDRFRPALKKIAADGKTAIVAHGHHLLAAPHILAGENVPTGKVATLDTKYPPGHVYAFHDDGKIDKLSK